MIRTRKTITMLLCASMFAAAVPASASEISLQIGNSTATVDGKETVLDSAPIILNDRTMLPVRFIAESLGMDVSWDPTSQSVTLSGVVDRLTNSKIGTEFKFKTDEEIAEENAGMDNPFGLVYDDAITENVDGAVNIHPISYDLNGIKIAANVYTPANYSESDSYAAVVVAHPNGGVKEQVAGLYAQHLAELGYIAITADAAYQGASGGAPRNIDNPANRVEDIHRMIDIISQYPGVDSERIGALGICGGGGYTIKAVQTDKRVKAVATLSMFNTGVVRRDGLNNASVDTIQERLDSASAARAKEAATGEVTYTANMLDTTTPEEAAALPDGMYKDGYFYYGVDYKHPNSTFAYTESSLLDLVQFDARVNANLIDQPLLMMAGSKADTLYLTEDVYNAATGTQDKELYLIDGASHIETYWVPEYVNEAVSKLESFFGSKL